jgi:hypothetical protein
MFAVQYFSLVVAAGESVFLANDHGHGNSRGRLLTDFKIYSFTSFYAVSN